MVLPLNKTPKELMSSLLTTASQQARNVQFNIQFNNLQRTTIGRLNEEIGDVLDTSTRQREVGRLTKAHNDLIDRSAQAKKFAFVNDNNLVRMNNVASAAQNALTAFSLGDADTGNISASEVEAYQAELEYIKEYAYNLQELNNPDFVDGENASQIIDMVTALEALTPVEGVLDDEDVSPATNDNRAIYEALGELATKAGAAADTATTMKVYAYKAINVMDSKIKSLDYDIKEITVFEAAEKEYEIQMLKSKYATFLRSIEIAFDTNSQTLNGLTEALNTEREFDKGSVVSILA